ncbi:MAG: hypothetical protein ABFS37_06410 [Acidobacteriota bacterium]
MRTSALLLLTLLLSNPSAVLASALEDRMERDLEGAWAALRVEVYSNCAGAYNDNRVHDSGVSAKADRRFEAGELVKIDRIKVKRSRVDLLLTLGEPILTSHGDGPFVLYAEAPCKVQLIFDVPRDWIKAGDHRKILGEIDQRLTTFSSYEAARTSALWNGRQRDPYPEDYELTLIQYEIWKAEERNLEIQARADQALETALQAASGVSDDPLYLKGFADGVQNMKFWSENDCDRLISATFSGHSDRPPRDRNKGYKQGYRDGQELVFNLILAKRLEGCYVPVPPMPE